VKLSSITEVYSQDEDCCGRASELGQEITISTHDGGGGPYVVIQTERWAMDDDKEIGELAAKLKAILKRVNV
jgi:hypothetical protein